MEASQNVLDRAKALLNKSGFQVTEAELQTMVVNDFGLGNFETEGFVLLDILRTSKVRTALLIMFPHQTLPQHLHPPYDTELGKEETLRVLYGSTKVYVRGEQNNPDIKIPVGKERYYTAKTEIALSAGQQYTIPETIEHWFQAGPEGSVNITFQNRVDEAKNVFYDPNSAGCAIMPSDTY